MGRLVGHSGLGVVSGFLHPGCGEEECPDRRTRRERPSRFKGGHARCECGAWSGHLPSTRTRQAWHRNHKSEVDLLSALQASVDRARAGRQEG